MFFIIQTINLLLQMFLKHFDMVLRGYIKRHSIPFQMFFFLDHDFETKSEAWNKVLSFNCIFSVQKTEMFVS